MLGLGWTEMLVIGVVALIFIGPKDLPIVMGRVGKIIGQVQRMGREFQREINKTTGLDEVRNLRTSITSPLKKTADEIRKEFNAIGTDGKQTPSGALKPTNPGNESVVEAIQQQAGMPPAKKTSDELAAEYGFTGGNKSEPVKAARASAKSSATAKVEAQTSAGSASAKPARATKPRAAAKAGGKPATTKSTRKPAAKTAAAKPTSSASSAEAKPAAKPRAARKKPADTAGKSE